MWVFALVALIVRGQSFWVCQFFDLVFPVACSIITLVISFCLSTQSLFCAQCLLLHGSAKVMCHRNFLFWHVSYPVVSGCDEICFLQEMNHFFLAVYSSLWWYICQILPMKPSLFSVHLKNMYYFSILGLLFPSVKWCVAVIYQVLYCKPIDWLPST